MTEEDQYAYRDKFPDSWKPWVFASKAARMRRRQLRLFRTEYRFRRPFWRFLSVTADIRVVALVAFWMTFWVFTAATYRNPVEWATLYFAVFIGLEFTYWLVVKFHGLVMRKMPKSMKIKVDTMPAIPAGDYIPGARIRTLSLPASETGKAREVVPVELIATGYVGKTQEGLTKVDGPVILAHARFTSADGKPCAAIVLAPDLAFIPSGTEEFLLGELSEWHAPVYEEAIRQEFKGIVTDSTLVVLAMQPYDLGHPETRPPTESYTRKEVYEARQRERAVTQRGTDQGMRDGMYDAARRRRE